MGRYVFDVFCKKEPYVVLPLNLVCRRRADNKIKPERTERYITTVSANSYDDAVRSIIQLVQINGNLGD